MLLVGINSVHIDLHTIVCFLQADNNYKLPDWTHLLFPDKMKNIAALVLASFTYTPLLKRLWGGEFIISAENLICFRFY